MIDLTPATERVAALVTAVDDDQLGDPTPCADYAVGDLLDHISTLATTFRKAADKTLPADSGGPPLGSAANLGPDWRSRIAGELQALGEAWGRPEAWEGMTRTGGMDVPGEMGGVVALEETVVHGWDLARATGQAYEASEAELEVVAGFFASFDAAARGDAFGLAEAVHDGATGLDRAVAQAGRDPEWSATP